VRLALISDVHGNDVAFAAVEADIVRLGVEQVVSLGDVAQGGPQPAETLARLARLGARAVMGNSDEFLLRVPVDSPEPVTARQLEVRDWTLARLGEADLDRLRAFEPTVALTLAEVSLLAFHASPRSHEDVLLPWSDDAAVDPYLDAGADVLAGGHTHTQWTRRIRRALFVNPGSVGLAYDHHQPQDDFRFTPAAEYAILNATGSSGSVEFRRVPYSADELAAAAAASGHPFARGSSLEWRRPPA